MTFTLKRFIDLNEGEPGLLVPLFQKAQVNVLFAQECDDYMTVTDMLPAYDADEYPNVDVLQEQFVSINGAGLIGIRDADRQISFVTMADLFEIFRSAKERITGHQFLNIQVSRLIGEDTQSIYPILRDFSAGIFNSKKNQKQWLNNELRHLQQNGGIWKQINAQDKIRQESKVKEFSNVRFWDFEQKIQWLIRNEYAESWYEVWRSAFFDQPFENRLLKIGEDQIANFYPDPERAKFLIVTLTSFLASKMYREGQLEIIGARFLSYIGETFEEHYGFIFNFVKNKGFIDDIIEIFPYYSFPIEGKKLILDVVRYFPIDGRLMKVIQWITDDSVARQWMDFTPLEQTEILSKTNRDIDISI